MTAIRATGGLELPRHVRDAGRTMAYALLGVGYGLVYIVVVGGGLILGAILSPAWVGLPLMGKVARLAWNLAEAERRQANRLLDAHLPPVPRPPRTDWRGTLEQTGYDVITAKTGEEALAAFEREEPDAVVLDLNLPGLPGWEVCRLLKAQCVQIECAQ